MSVPSLTAAVLEEATGETRLGSLRDAEIIFTNVQTLAGGGLDSCTSLSSLTLIDTGLQSPLCRGPELSGVSATLARLCITEQTSLKRLGSLRLPALRDLLLHSNGLESLEGLEGCPRIQRLWVWGNRLRSLSGLHAQADLRELWAQDNRLERVAGVEHLVSLQVLDVAGNPVANLRDVQKLAHLPRLRSVSFSDPHFGSCPVVRAAGYRQFVLASLPALTHLDGRTVGPQDRDGADEAFLRQAEEFEAAREQREGAFDEVLDRLAARAGSAADAEAAAGEELAALVRGLEGTVRRGRAAVEAEGARVVRVQAEARRELERSAGAIEGMRADWVRRAEAAGEQALAGEREALGWCEVEDACLRAFERAFVSSAEEGEGEEDEEQGGAGARADGGQGGAALSRQGRKRGGGSSKKAAGGGEGEGEGGSSSRAGAAAAAPATDAARDRSRGEGQDGEGSYSEDEGWAEDDEDEDEEQGRGRGGAVPGGGGRFVLPSLPLLVAQLPPHAPDAKAVLAEARTACAAGAADLLRCGRCHSPVAEAALEAVASARAAAEEDEGVRPVEVPAAAFGSMSGPGGGAGWAAPRLWVRGSAGLERVPREGWLVGAPAAVASVLRIGAGGGAGGALRGGEPAGDRGKGWSGGAVFAPTLEVALEAAREAGAGLRCASRPSPAAATAVAAGRVQSALAACACRCEVLGLLADGGAAAESPIAQPSSTGAPGLPAAPGFSSSPAGAAEGRRGPGAALAGGLRWLQSSGGGNAALVPLDGTGSHGIAFRGATTDTSRSAASLLLLLLPDAIATLAVRLPGPAAPEVPRLADMRARAEQAAGAPLLLPPPSSSISTQGSNSRAEGDETGIPASFAGMFAEAELAAMQQACSRRECSDGGAAVCEAAEAAVAATRRDYAIAVLHGVAAPLAQSIGKARARAGRSRAEVERAMEAATAERALQQALVTALQVEDAPVSRVLPARLAPVGLGGTAEEH